MKFWKLEEEKFLNENQLAKIEKFLLKLNDYSIEELDIIQSEVKELLTRLLDNNNINVSELLQSETFKVISKIAYYDKLFDQKAAAAYLKVSRQYASLLVKEGRISYFIAGVTPDNPTTSKRKLFYKSELDNYLLARKIESIN